MVHDLLTDPILTWRSARGLKGRTTLPGALSLIANGQLADFPRLRAHQFHPWCMFITQLAAIALRRGGRTDPDLTEDEWRQYLLGLTDGQHEAWCLVVEDLSRPAFFQPPVTERGIGNWNISEHPDDIDILVTAKAHDVKAGLISSDDIEAWTHALVTLQTMQGFLGQGNYGIARMNGGFGNRPRLAVASEVTIASAFLRDLDTLLSTWSLLVTDHGYSEDGLALLWIREWNGEDSLPRATLSPHFIEVCRRVRLEVTPNGLHCTRAPSSGRRSLPEVDNGDVGDPWIPIKRDTDTALTVGERGFDYKLLAELLLEGDYRPGAASVLCEQDGDPVVFSAWALARGKGETKGLHERTLLLAGRARFRLGRPDGRAALGRRAKDWIADADKMRSKVLFPALKKIALGQTVPSDAFSGRVDEIFFDRLFVTIEAPEDEARFTFEGEISEIAWNELQRAIDRCTVPDARRLKVISEAESLFRGCLRKQFPDLIDESNGQRGAAS